MSLRKDFANWLKTVPDEVLIDAYLKAECDEDTQRAILWCIFLDETNDVEFDSGYWVVDVKGTVFSFRPFENCDAMTGRAYDNLMKRLIRCVFTNTYQPIAADWIWHHATTCVEGSNQSVDLSKKNQVYRRALEDFLNHQFENDPPIPGKSYYSARWVWED